MPTVSPAAPPRTPSHPHTPSSPSIGRLASTSAPGGFAPGAILDDRYRIIGLLGRGGMGEVYRADDLKLAQPVALKFLPPAYEKDPVFLERFLGEVRTARQVSHPNVCRVYDVGEYGGRHFLSMEYVDGEDLATLLKRIGRLPAAKATEIARQLCAGLAAAHGQGVLHRDIKPSNVMIDGHGRARLTDFGLAVAATDSSAQEFSGTPAYMAPEQLNGEGASLRTDLYSLGLVLYEVYTGKRAFSGASLAELRRAHSEQSPAPPSSHAADVEPAVERAILRCLEKDPARRPASAMQLAASLPGGDPLAAALAAGETPSPEMVAAAGEEGSISAARAAALAGAALLLLFAAVWLARVSTVAGLVRPEKSPEVLLARGREIAERFGYPNAVDRTGWYATDVEHLRWRAQKLPSPQRLRDLGSLRPTVIYFVYRQSPRNLIPVEENGIVTMSDPPLEISGMVTISIDDRGRLRSFRAVVPQLEEAPAAAPPPDWAMLFAEAGLDISAFTPVAPKWTPQVPFEARLAWESPIESYPGEKLVVTAASWRGKPVWFAIAGPWNRPMRQEQEPVPASTKIASVVSTIMVMGLVFGSAYMARRNLRMGRGDRKGALRLALAVLALGLLDWVTGAHLVPEFGVVFNSFMDNLADATFMAVLFAVIYLALEPYVRSRMPNLLIAWSRLIAGGYRDPLVGRDVLIGLMTGTFLAAVSRAVSALPWWFDLKGMIPSTVSRFALGSFTEAVSLTASGITQGLLNGLAILGVLFFLRLLLRKYWLAVGVLTLMLSLLFVGEAAASPWFSLFGVLMSATLVFTMVRFGLVAFAAAWCTFFVVNLFQAPLEFGIWYGNNVLLAAALIAGLVIYAFRTSLGGRALFSGASLDN